MFENDYFIERMIKERQNAFLKEARDLYRLDEIRKQKPDLKARFFLKLGQYLISLGTRLRTQYQPLSHLDPSCCKNGR